MTHQAQMQVQFATMVVGYSHHTKSFSLRRNSDGEWVDSFSGRPYNEILNDDDVEWFDVNLEGK